MVTDYYYFSTLLLTKIGSCNTCDYTNTDCMYYNVHDSYRNHIIVEKVIRYNSYNYIMLHQR